MYLFIFLHLTLSFHHLYFPFFLFGTKTIYKTSYTRIWQKKIVMTTASQQQRVPTWREIVGSSLLVEYELKFDVNFSQRKHFYFITVAHQHAGKKREV